MSEFMDNICDDHDFEEYVESLDKYFGRFEEGFPVNGEYDEYFRAHKGFLHKLLGFYESQRQAKLRAIDKNEVVLGLYGMGIEAEIGEEDMKLLESALSRMELPKGQREQIEKVFEEYKEQGQLTQHVELEGCMEFLLRAARADMED